MAGPFVVSRNEVVIDAPAQQVFDYLADMTRHHEWNPDDGFRVTARPEGQPGVGSVFSRERTGESQGPLAIRPGPGPASSVTVTLSTAITVYRPPCALTFETRASYNGLLYSIERTYFELQPAPEGIRVAKLCEVEIMVPSAFIGPVYAIRVVRAALRRILGNRLPGLFPRITVGPHLARIKEAVESGQALRET